MSGPSDRDTWWVANRAAPATYVHLNYVQSSLGDIEAALAERDWETVVAAAAEAVISIGYCRLVLGGLEGTAYDGEVRLHLAAGPHGPLAAEAAAQARLPDAVGATRADADAARQTVLGLAGALAAELPSALPEVRTSDGFFPAVRIAKDYEQLRGRLGLAPLNWIAWLH
jgi:hypothetical protein